LRAGVGQDDDLVGHLEFSGQLSAVSRQLRRFYRSLAFWPRIFTDSHG
jgi:hypothetical protein